MTRELDKRTKQLYELITKEKDNLVFPELVMDLSQRLEVRDKTLDRQIELVSGQRDQLFEISSPTFCHNN
jgi:hypothetical protein